MLRLGLTMTMRPDREGIGIGITQVLSSTAPTPTHITHQVLLSSTPSQRQYVMAPTSVFHNVKKTTFMHVTDTVERCVVVCVAGRLVNLVLTEKMERMRYNYVGILTYEKGDSDTLLEAFNEPKNSSD
ncbi:translation initiation factor [Moniliophthora roreri]|nr:translation initiation factor [Moniliophthora roreri]